MKRPAMLAAIAIAGFVLGFAGCGGDDNGGGGASTTSPIVTTSTIPLPIPTGTTNVGTTVGTTTDDRGGGGGDDDG
jgi:hypothetical protein